MDSGQVMYIYIYIYFFIYTVLHRIDEPNPAEADLCVHFSSAPVCRKSSSKQTCEVISSFHASFIGH